MIWLAGCTSPSVSTPASLQARATALPSTLQPTKRPTSTLTPSLRPVIEVSPTKTGNSVTAMVTPTMTPLPPLTTTEEALAFAIDMQKTNGGCELPCWWGITPGKTLGRDARLMLSPLKNFGESYVVNVTKPPKLVDTFDLRDYSNMSVRLETKESEVQPVDILEVSSLISDADRSSQYDTSWQRYYLNDLFARLGMPSEVWLGFGRHTGDADTRPPESVPYYWGLYIYYDDLGLSVEYAGPAIKGNPNRACFSFSQLKTLNVVVQQHSVSGPPGEPFGEVHPLQEVTNLSLEKFYQTVKDSKDVVCVESPAKYWP